MKKRRGGARPRGCTLWSRRQEAEARRWRAAGWGASRAALARAAAEGLTQEKRVQEQNNGSQCGCRVMGGQSEWSPSPSKDPDGVAGQSARLLSGRRCQSRSQQTSRPRFSTRASPTAQPSPRATRRLSQPCVRESWAQGRVPIAASIRHGLAHRRVPHARVAADCCGCRGSMASTISRADQWTARAAHTAIKRPPALDPLSLFRSKANRASHDHRFNSSTAGVLPVAYVATWLWRTIILDRKLSSRRVVLIDGDGLRASMMGDMPTEISAPICLTVLLQDLPCICMPHRPTPNTSLHCFPISLKFP